MKIANPIYDIVFKYLMEDERILHRLSMAAADSDMRHRMNVETDKTLRQ